MDIENIRLKLLGEASSKLIKILDIDELLRYLLNIARRGLFADRGTVYVVDKSKNEIWSKVLIGNNLKEIRLPIGKGIAGRVAQTGETINIEDAYEDDRFNKDVDIRTGYRTKTIICMPIKNADGEIVGVFQILNKQDGKFNSSDIEFLESLSYYSATALELATLHQERLDKKRLEHELKIAREIQIGLLPKTIPNIEGYEIFGNNNTCEEVSGDYYEYFPIDEKKWLFAIGDVSGKGIPASLLMAVLQSHLKAIVRFNQSTTEIIENLNEYIRENSTVETFITFFLGILDLENHIFEYVNAGHNNPFCLKRNGNLLELNKGGTILGMFSGLEYNSEKISLESGDFVFCYTDGVTECFNKNNEEYGETRLLDFLKIHRNKKLNKILSNLNSELEMYSSGQKQPDDITVLMIRRK